MIKLYGQTDTTFTNNGDDDYEICYYKVIDYVDNIKNWKEVDITDDMIINDVFDIALI